MTLPVHKIIWAETDPVNHGDHLHVEGDPPLTGLEIPGDCTRTRTESINTIIDALETEFGSMAYFLDDNAVQADWLTMGIYSCRYIAGTTIPTQHAGSNAIDIGPYYGVAAQERFYKFLKGETMTLPDQVKIPLEWWAKDVFQEMIEKGYYTEETNLDKVRETYEFQQITVNQHRTIQGEIRRAMKQVGAGTTESRVKELIRSAGHEI